MAVVVADRSAGCLPVGYQYNPTEEFSLACSRFSSRSIDAKEISAAIAKKKLHCEEILYKGKTVASFCYLPGLTEEYQKKGWPKALYIKVAGIKGMVRRDVSVLCCRMVEVAHKLNAQFIVMYIYKTKNEEFAKEIAFNGFSFLKNESQDRAYTFLSMQNHQIPALRFEQLLEEKKSYKNASVAAGLSDGRANLNVGIASIFAVTGKGLKRKREDGDVQPPCEVKCARVEPRYPLQKPLEVTLRKPYVHMIQSGAKTKEGRINTGIFKGIRVGDHIKFFSQQDYVICEVTAVEKFAGFQQMLEAGSVAAYLPDTARSPDPMQLAVKLYYSIPGYFEKARQHGVLGLSLKKAGEKE